MMKRGRICKTSFIAVIPIFAFLGCGPGRERTVVLVQYETIPAKRLPPGMANLAVLPAETVDEAETIWSDLAANMVQGLLSESNDRYGHGLRFADRDNIKRVLDEKDLALSGIADGSEAAATAKLLAADGLVCTKVSVKVEKHEGTGRTFSLAGLGGRPRLESRDATKVTRNITVLCSFRVVDAATGRAWMTHVGDTLQQLDEGKPSPFYGSDRSEADLTPRDQIIGRLVERSVRDFVQNLVPIPTSVEIELESDRDELSGRAVRLAAAGDDEAALKAFQQVLQADPESDRAAYGAGVMCERLGKFDDALEFYRKAISIEIEPDYVDARKRVEGRRQLSRAPGT